MTPNTPPRNPPRTLSGVNPPRTDQASTGEASLSAIYPPRKPPRAPRAQTSTFSGVSIRDPERRPRFKRVPWHSIPEPASMGLGDHQ